MALTREEKEQVVADIAAVAGQATALVAAEYRGLTVTELTELRQQARESGVSVRVIKNNLARLAFHDTGLSSAEEHLLGPLLFGFSEQEPSAGAKVFSDFSKGHEHLQMKFAVVDGTLLDAGGIAKLASLPSREHALAMLMGVLRAPLEQVVRAHAEIPGRMVRVLAACRDQKKENS